MKFSFSKTLFALSLVQINVAHAQLSGAVITIDNTGAGPVFLNTSQGVIRAPAEGTFVEVFARPVGSSEAFTRVSSIKDKDVFELVAPGVIAAGFSRPLPGFEPKQHGEFFVRGWRGAATWQEAQNDLSAFIGRTPVFMEQTGEVIAGDYFAERFKNMPSFTLQPVPEPSTIALGALALFTMFAFKRRAKARR